jgi:hypothetical protein
MRLQYRLYDSYPEWNFILVRTYMQHNYFIWSKFDDKQMYLSNRVFCRSHDDWGNNANLNSATLHGLEYEQRGAEHGGPAVDCVPRRLADLQRVRLLHGRHVPPSVRRVRGECRIK